MEIAYATNEWKVWARLRVQSYGAELAERLWLVVASFRRFRSAKMWFPISHAAEFPEYTISVDQSREPSRRSVSLNLPE